MKLIFIFKRRDIDNIHSFWFKPAEPVSWIAGQSIRLEIEGDERRFTIASAPYEKNIAVTTRLSGSPFKQALAALRPGDKIDGYNIEGSFIWSTTIIRKLLLASGIGITAYYPILKQLQHEKKSLEATLVYANRDERFLFGNKLRQLQIKHPELRLEFLPGQRLSQAIIEKHCPRLAQSLVYLSGPEAMVNDISQLLAKSGVKEPMLKKDLFTGRPGWELS